jgi:hypothetical protein
MPQLRRETRGAFALNVRRFSLVAVLATTALLLVAAGTQAANLANVRVPVSFVSSDFCADQGEPIAYDGFMHIVYNFTTDGAGGFHEIQVADAQYSGVGVVTGDKYVVTAADHIVGNYPDSGTSIVSMTMHVERIHAGETTQLDDSYYMMVLSPGGYTVEQEGCR